MSLATLKLIKSTAIFSIYFSVSLLYLILLSVLYKIIINPAKVKNKKRIDIKFYFFLKHYHPHMGGLMLLGALYHGIFMAFYLIVRGANFFPYFGFLALITFLLVSMSGMMTYYRMRMPNISIPNKKKTKNIHGMLGGLAFLFFLLHLYEVKKEHIIKTVEKYKKVPIVNSK